MDQEYGDDIKLRSTPVVLLERLDLIQYIDQLSQDCLENFLVELQANVAESQNVEEDVIQPSEENKNASDDEIQVIEVKQKSAALRKPLQRSATAERKLRRDPLHTVKNSLKKTPNKAIKMASTTYSEKLMALKERESRLMNEIRKQKVIVDASVQEELNAMAVLGNYTPLSTPKIPKTPNVEKAKKTKPPLSTSAMIAPKKSLQTPALSSEEKFRVLEERDKLFHAARKMQVTKKIVGTCPDMCPEKERHRRIYQSQLSPFEMENGGGGHDKMGPRMVKEYARSSADQDAPLPHELRPVHVLEMTMNYLCRYIADRSEGDDSSLEEWYVFMWDRTRAIRKDITQQDLCDIEAARLIEQTARFHIHCAERLSEQELSVYDDKINSENLTKCLQTLKYMYCDLASLGVICPNAPEFLCYSLLLNLNNPAIITEVRDMPEEIAQSEPIKFALDIMSARETKNYIRFFKLVKNTSYLNGCILRRYFGEMRLLALQTMVHGFCSRSNSTAMYVDRLVDLLLFENETECVTHLRLCSLEVEMRNGQQIVIFEKRAFQMPDIALPSSQSLRYIQEKKRTLLSEVIWGGPLGPDMTENHIIQNSFTPNGVFRLNTIPSDVFSAEASIEKKTEAFPTVDFTDDVIEIPVAKPEPSFRKPAISAFQFEPPSNVNANNNAPSIVSSKSIFATSPTTPFRGFGVPQSSVGVVQSSGKGFSFGNSIFDLTPKAPAFPEPPSIPVASTPPTVVVGDPPTTPLQKKSVESATPSLVLAFKFSVPSDVQVSSSTSAPSPATIEKKELFKPPTPAAQKLPNRKIWTQEEEENYQRLRKAEEDAREKVEVSFIRLKQVVDRQLRKREKKERKLEEEKRQRKIEEEKLREAEKRAEERRRAIDDEKRAAEEKRRRIQSRKLQELHSKYQKWKMREFIQVWRQKVWFSKEARKVEKYMESLKRNYPPICSEDLLDGNPLGIIIPNKLALRKRREDPVMRRSLVSRAQQSVGPSPAFPLVHIGSVVAETLKSRLSHLYPDPTSVFHTCFPWKLVLCLPDDQETSVRLDTFLEMHFVEDFNWKLGVEVLDVEQVKRLEGAFHMRIWWRATPILLSHFSENLMADGRLLTSAPLTNCIHKIGALELHIIVRRVRGSELFEGSTPNKNVIIGANCAIFFVTDDISKMPVARQRLNTLRSAPGGTQVPILTFVFGNRISERRIRHDLKLSDDSPIITCCGSSQQSLVTTLSRSLSVAADVSAAIPDCQAITLKSFLLTDHFEKLWRRVDVALVNYDILLTGPEPLIEYWNCCLNNLYDLFSDSSLYDLPRVAPEFESVMSRLRPPYQLCTAPNRDQSYLQKLKCVLDTLKLPQWTQDDVKTTQALNFKIHQYCKKVVSGDNFLLKHLKWRIYQDIQKTLLWKGFDIYCDEDINIILLRLPWTSVFKDIAKFSIEQFLSSDIDLPIILNEKIMEELLYRPSLVDKLIRSAESISNLDIPLELADISPHPENDSIFLSFVQAVELEQSLREEEEEELIKRKRKSRLSTELEDILERKKPLLESSSVLKRSYEDMDKNIDDLQAKLYKRRCELESLANEFLP